MPDTSAATTLAVFMDLTIRSFRDALDEAAFRELSQEWISRYFEIEDHDAQTEIG
jgi:hypothetical protein